jgi:RNA polymerase sigma-70 factor (ECF subfamily)
LLAAVAPSPVVELNRAVSVAAADGPAPGLEIVDRIATSGALSSYHLLHATRADLLRRPGRDAETLAAHRCAAELATNGPERAFL